MFGEITMLTVVGILLALFLLFWGAIVFGRALTFKAFLVAVTLLLLGFAFSAYRVGEMGPMTSPEDLVTRLLALFLPLYGCVGLFLGHAARDSLRALEKALAAGLELLERDRLQRRPSLIIAHDLAAAAKLLSGLGRRAEAEQYYLEAVALVEKEVPGHPFLAGVYVEFLRTLRFSKSDSYKLVRKKLADLKFD